MPMRSHLRKRKLNTAVVQEMSFGFRMVSLTGVLLSTRPLFSGQLNVGFYPQGNLQRLS